MTRSYWPCTLVAHEAHFSIVLGAPELDLLAHHFGGRDAGGYAIEGLVKKLVRQKHPELLRRVELDSEASMFCALGPDLDALHAVAALLAEATGTTEAATRSSATRAQQTLTPEDDRAARRCLIQGFILELDPAAQERFRALVPRSPAGADQERWLGDLEDVDPAVRATAARRLARQASSSVWSWESFVGDPRFAEVLRSVVERETDDDVLLALLTLACAACGRHLADLRLRSTFEARLRHPNPSVRQQATRCVATLFSWSWDALVPLFDDPSPAVRAAVVGAAEAGEESFVTNVSDDFAYYERNGVPAAVYERVVSALADKNAVVRSAAAYAVCAMALEGSEEVLRGAMSREKTAKVRAALERGIGLIAYNDPVRPCRWNGALELTRFRRLAAKGLDGPDVERALRTRFPALLARVEVSSRRGYFATWGPDTEAVQAVATAIRQLT